MTPFDPIEEEEQIGYDPNTETYHAHADDMGGDSIAYTVIAAVASLSGEKPADLPPLTRVINADALENLIAPAGERPLEEAVSVTFAYDDCEVIVETGGHVIIDPPASLR